MLIEEDAQICLRVCWNECQRSCACAKQHLLQFCWFQNEAPNDVIASE